MESDGPPNSPEQMDASLVLYLEEMFFEGEELHRGTTMLAALLHKWPEMGRGIRTSLPRSRQSLQGWKRMGPSRARLPLPWLIAAGAAHWMVENVSAVMSPLTVLTFVCYLRP